MTDKPTASQIWEKIEEICQGTDYVFDGHKTRKLKDGKVRGAFVLIFSKTLPSGHIGLDYNSLYLAFCGGEWLDSFSDWRKVMDWEAKPNQRIKL